MVAVSSQQPPNTFWIGTFESVRSLVDYENLLQKHYSTTNKTNIEHESTNNMSFKLINIFLNPSVYKHTIPKVARREPGGSGAEQPQATDQSWGGRAAAGYFKLSLARVSPAGRWWGDPRLTKPRSNLATPTPSSLFLAHRHSYSSSLS